MTSIPPAPPSPSRRNKAAKRLIDKVPALVVSAGVGLAAALAARGAGMPGAWGEVGLAAAIITALCFSHMIFIDTLFDAHARATRRGKLYRNLGWSVFYVGLFVLLYAGLFGLGGVVQNGQVVTGDLPLSLFLSVITWTTVGYGDITPASGFSRIVAGMEAMNGYLVMAIFIAALVQTFERLAGD